MLLSDWTKQRERIYYLILTVLEGIEKREGVEFRESKHDIASWLVVFLPDLKDLT